MLAIISLLGKNAGLSIPNFANAKEMSLKKTKFHKSSPLGKVQTLVFPPYALTLALCKDVIS